MSIYSCSLCIVSSLHINVDMSSDESSFHMLYPGIAGHMETVGSFFGIDTLNGQHDFSVCKCIFLQ